MIFPLRYWPALFATAALPLRAQLAYPGCDALQASDFKVENLFNKNGSDGAAADPSLTEPTRMDVHAVFDATGAYQYSHAIFVERRGKVKWYDGAAKTVSLMGSLDVHAGGSDLFDDNGLMGVVFHPDFDRNRWVFLWYIPSRTFDQSMTGSGQNRQLRLSRWKVTEDHKLDMNSEKIILKILGSTTDRWHSGGPMTFDAYGDLWIAIGNNSLDLVRGECSNGGNVLSQTDSAASAEWSSSDTHNMRGGFLRIHPDTSAKGYSVPRGNFGEYWADKFEQQGKNDLAAQYRDSSKVLPEVYVKGERSNFSIAVHPTKRWLGWGTVNYDNTFDEFNITDHPIFSGYPYFMADNRPTCDHGKLVEAPTNNSSMNGGVTQLPPAVPGTLNNIINVAIGGPIYAFDPAQPYAGKFPPHFDDKWIVAGFGRRGSDWDMWAVTLDTTADPFGAKEKESLKSGLFKDVPIRNFIGATYGREGALYILNYDGDYGTAKNPGLVRVSYTGACQVIVSNAPRELEASYQKILFSSGGITVGEGGGHGISLHDLTGRRVWAGHGEGPREYRFADIRARNSLPPGLYLARVATPTGDITRRVTIF